MATLNEKEQVTFIFSTHDQRVMDKARRIITLEDGKVISDTKSKVKNAGIKSKIAFAAWALLFLLAITNS